MVGVISNRLGACNVLGVPLCICSRLLSGLLLGLTCYPATVLSAPTGGEVVAGEGHIAQQGTRTDVTQQSQRMVVDWQEFNVGTQEHVHFEQPNSRSSVLNRIYQGNESRILGRLSARGQVWLLNPNGVIFGRNSRVDVGGLVAAGLWMDQTDFMAGRYVLDASRGAGPVRNAGVLEASSSGIGLAGSSVENSGQVLAYSSRVELASGSQVAVDFDGDGLLHFALREGIQGGVENAGELQGKQVVLSARAASDVFTQVLNTGEHAVQAEHRDGRVELTAASRITAERVSVSGETIDASGRINVSAQEDGGAHMVAEDTLQVSATVEAVSKEESGGEVTLLAEHIELGSEAALDVSGAHGGGRIRVGGGYQGAPIEGRTAETVTVAEGATATADATDSGDGGTIIFWSEGTTLFSGWASARGGTHGGDGGFVEVSGRTHLGWRGTADLRAPWGRAGLLLLDPGTVRICDDMDTGCTALMNDVFTDTGIETSLGMGDLTIATSTATSGMEDINVEAGVEIAWTTTNTLTLNAGQNINIGETKDTMGVTISGAGNLVLDAGRSVNINVAMIGDFTGGTGDDTFNVNAAYSGTMAGGAGDDTFDVDATVTGAINGGGDADTFYLGATVTMAVSGGAGGDIFTLESGGSASSLDGGADTDTLNGYDQDVIWAVSGGGGGDYGSQSFTGMEHLVGGSMADTFMVMGSVAGNLLSGMGGTDTLMGWDALAAWVVDGMNSGTYSGAFFMGIENLAGGSGTDTFDLQSSGSLSGGITGGAGGNTYELNGGTVGMGITAGGDGDTFNVHAAYSGTLTGGAGDDTFDVDAMVTGALNGGKGADEFDLDAVAVGTLDGGADTDTLMGRDAGVIWVVSGVGSGMYDSQVFTGMEYLVGGTGTDTLSIATALGSTAVALGPTTVFLYGNATADDVQGEVRVIDEMEVSEEGEVYGDAISRVIDAYAGMDVITGREQDFLVVSAVTNPDDITTDADLVVNPADPRDPAGGLTLPDLRALMGTTVIGGTLISSFRSLDAGTEGLPLVAVPTAARPSPADPSPVGRRIQTGTLTLAGEVHVGGDLVLLGGQVHLGAAASAVGEFVVVASGAHEMSGTPMMPGELRRLPASGDGNIHIEAPVSAPIEITARSGVLIAASDIVDDAGRQGGRALTLRLGSGPENTLQAVLGERSEVSLNPASRFVSQSLAVSIDAYVELLGLEDLQRVLFILNTDATDLTSLGSILFVDVSLFEQELSLYGTVGYGMALALVQCEELEGCAPAVTVEEIDRIISSLEDRIEAVRAAMQDPDADTGERAQLQQELAELQDRLQAFENLREEFIEFGISALSPEHPPRDMQAADGRIPQELRPELRRLWQQGVRLLFEERYMHRPSPLQVHHFLSPVYPVSCVADSQADPCPDGFSPG